MTTTAIVLFCLLFAVIGFLVYRVGTLARDLEIVAKYTTVLVFLHQQEMDILTAQAKEKMEGKTESSKDIGDFS